MWLRTKTVRKKGREYRYRYLQHSVRVGKKVKTLSYYLGAAVNFVKIQGWKSDGVDEVAMTRSVNEQEARYKASIESWSKETGLKMPDAQPAPDTEAQPEAPTEVSSS